MDDDRQAGTSREPFAPRGTAATQAWFDQLESSLGALLAAHEPGGTPPGSPLGGGGGGVGDRERALLLDLARIAAHHSERWTAPISTYLVGVALAPHGPAVRAQVLTELVAGLEPPTG